MSNCCMVNHVITPVDSSDAALKQLADCHKVLSAYQSMFTKHSERSALWHIMADFYGSMRADKTNCRSTIVRISRVTTAKNGQSVSYNGIRIEEDTANLPCTEAWDAVMTSFPLLKRAWCAEEPDCDIYLKHDPDGAFFADKSYEEV